jgi:hypothetical protein
MMTQSMPAPCALRRGARVTSVTVSDVCVVCCRASSRLPCDLRVSVRDASTRTHCKIDTQRTQDSIGKFAFGDRTIPIHARTPDERQCTHPRTRWACTTVQYRVCSGAHCSVPNRQHTSGIRRTRRSLLHVSSTPTIVTDTFPPRVACPRCF